MHAPYDPASSLHANVAVPSVELKAKLAEREFVGLLGPESIVTSGGVRSTCHEYDADAEFPTPSVARTLNLCVPSAIPE